MSPGKEVGYLRRLLQEERQLDTRITATELARSLSDILNRVRYRSETFLVERNGEAIASLAAAAGPAGAKVRDLVAALKEVPPPGEDFGEDLESIQRSQHPVEPPKWR